MENSEIGFAHLALLARTANALSESDTSRGFEETAFLAQATEVSISRFRHICHHARHANDPAGYVADEVEVAEPRKLERKSGEGGWVFVSAVLDAAGRAGWRPAIT